MENNSIGKNLSEVEIYSVGVMVDDFSVIDNHVTLDRGTALLKAYNMYYEYKDKEKYYNIFIDTWKNDILVKVEYIDNNENLVVGYENYNV